LLSGVTAVIDAYHTGTGTALSSSRSVLANDQGVSSGATANLVQTAAHGTLTLIGDGTFSYTPDSGYTGIDSFRYSVSDGSETSNTVTVSLAVGDISETDTSTAYALNGANNRIAGYVGDGSEGSSDIDLYRVTLTAGQTLKLDIDAVYLDDGTSWSSLNSHVRLFDEYGYEVASNGNGIDPQTGVGSTDSVLTYRASSGGGTYYIGISGAGNEWYSLGSSSGSGSGGSTGQYELAVEVVTPPPLVFTESSYSLSIPLDTATNTVLKTLAVDNEEGSVYFYSESWPFTVNSSTGAITLSDPGYLSVGQTYSFTVTASDAYQSVSTTVTIHVTAPLNQPPEFGQSSYNYYVPLDAASNFLVGTLTATDPENNSLTFSDNGYAYPFYLNSNGQLRLSDNTYLSVGQTYMFTATVNDAYGQDTATVTIHITAPVNQPPAFIQSSYSFNVPLDAASNSLIGTLTATDPENNSLTFSDNGNAYPFYLNSNGELRLSDNSYLSVGQTYTFTALVNDAYGQDTATVTIHITEPVNQAPTFSVPTYAFNVPLDKANGSAVGSLQVSDPENDSLTFYDSGNAYPFYIDDNGAVRLFEASYLQVGQTYTFEVTVRDQYSFDTATVTIHVTAPVNQPPEFAQSTYSFNVLLDSASNFLVGTLTATDPENNSLTFSGGEEAYPFYLNSNGQLRLSDNMYLSVGQTYTFTATVADAYGQDTATITIHVTAPANQPPSFSAPTYSFDVPVNAVSYASVGTLVATDPENNPLTFSASENAYPIYVDSSGTVRVYESSYFQVGQTYTFDVTVQDQYGQDTATVTIHVTEPADSGNTTVTAVPDSLVIANRTQTYLIDVLANDTAGASAVLSITSVQQPQHGSVTIVPSEEGPVIQFIPDETFVGLTSFTYVVSDAAGHTSTGTVVVYQTDGGSGAAAAAQAAIDAAIAAINAGTWTPPTGSGGTGSSGSGTSGGSSSGSGSTTGGSSSGSGSPTGGSGGSGWTPGSGSGSSTTVPTFSPTDYSTETITLKSGYVVTARTAFTPTSTESITETTSGVIPIDDLIDPDEAVEDDELHVVGSTSWTLTITYNYFADGSWTYSEVYSDTTETTGTSEDSSTGTILTDATYGYVFTASGDATGSAYTLTIEIDADITGSFTETTLTTDATSGLQSSSTFTSNWTNIDSTDITISNTTNATETTAAVLVDSTTTFSSSGTGTYWYELTGGRVDGTLYSTETNEVHSELAITEQKADGTWQAVTSSASLAAESESEYGFSGSGNYSRTDAAGTVAGTLTEHGSTKASATLSAAFVYDAQHLTWAPTSGSGSVDRDSNFAQTYSGSGTLVATMDGTTTTEEFEESGTVTSTTTAVGTLGATDGKWHGTETATTLISTESLEESSGTYVTEGKGRDLEGTLSSNFSFTSQSTSVIESTLGETSWAVTKGRIDETSQLTTSSTSSGSGTYSYSLSETGEVGGETSKQGAVSHDVAESSNDSASVATTTSQTRAADGKWTYLSGTQTGTVTSQGAYSYSGGGTYYYALEDESGGVTGTIGESGDISASSSMDWSSSVDAVGKWHRDSGNLSASSTAIFNQTFSGSGTYATTKETIQSSGTIVESGQTDFTETSIQKASSGPNDTWVYFDSHIDSSIEIVADSKLFGMGKITDPGSGDSGASFSGTTTESQKSHIEYEEQTLRLVLADGKLGTATGTRTTLLEFEGGYSMGGSASPNSDAETTFSVDVAMTSSAGMRVQSKETETLQTDAKWKLSSGDRKIESGSSVSSVISGSGTVGGQMPITLTLGGGTTAHESLKQTETYNTSDEKWETKEGIHDTSMSSNFSVSFGGGGTVGGQIPITIGISGSMQSSNDSATRYMATKEGEWHLAGGHKNESESFDLDVTFTGGGSIQSSDIPLSVGISGGIGSHTSSSRSQTAGAGTGIIGAPSEDAEWSGPTGGKSNDEYSNFGMTVSGSGTVTQQGGESGASGPSATVTISIVSNDSSTRHESYMLSGFASSPSSGSGGESGGQTENWEVEEGSQTASSLQSTSIDVTQTDSQVTQTASGTQTTSVTGTFSTVEKQTINQSSILTGVDTWQASTGSMSQFSSNASTSKVTTQSTYAYDVQGGSVSGSVTFHAEQKKSNDSSTSYLLGPNGYLVLSMMQKSEEESGLTHMQSEGGGSYSYGTQGGSVTGQIDEQSTSDSSNSMTRKSTSTDGLTWLYSGQRSSSNSSSNSVTSSGTGTYSYGASANSQGESHSVSGTIEESASTQSSSSENQTWGLNIFTGEWNGGSGARQFGQSTHSQFQSSGEGSWEVDYFFNSHNDYGSSIYDYSISRNGGGSIQEASASERGTELSYQYTMTPTGGWTQTSGHVMQMNMSEASNKSSGSVEVTVAQSSVSRVVVPDGWTHNPTWNSRQTSGTTESNGSTSRHFSQQTSTDYVSGNWVSTGATSSQSSSKSHTSYSGKGSYSRGMPGGQIEGTIDSDSQEEDHELTDNYDATLVNNQWVTAGGLKRQHDSTSSASSWHASGSFAFIQLETDYYVSKAPEDSSHTGYLDITGTTTESGSSSTKHSRTNEQKFTGGSWERTARDGVDSSNRSSETSSSAEGTFVTFLKNGKEGKVTASDYTTSRSSSSTNKYSETWKILGDTWFQVDGSGKITSGNSSNTSYNGTGEYISGIVEGEVSAFTHSETANGSHDETWTWKMEGGSPGYWDKRFEDTSSNNSNDSFVYSGEGTATSNSYEYYPDDKRNPSDPDLSMRSSTSVIEITENGSFTSTSGGSSNSSGIVGQSPQDTLSTSISSVQWNTHVTTQTIESSIEVKVPAGSDHGQATTTSTSGSNNSDSTVTFSSTSNSVNEGHQTSNGNWDYTSSTTEEEHGTTTADSNSNWSYTKTSPSQSYTYDEEVIVEAFDKYDYVSDGMGGQTVVQGDRYTEYHIFENGVESHPNYSESYGPETKEGLVRYDSRRYTFNDGNPPPRPGGAGTPSLGGAGGDGYSNAIYRGIGNTIRAVVGDDALARATDLQLYAGTVIGATVAVGGAWAAGGAATAAGICGTITYGMIGMEVAGVAVNGYRYATTGQGGADFLRSLGELGISVFANQVRRPLQLLARIVEGVSGLYGAGESAMAGYEAYNREDYKGAALSWTMSAMSGLAGAGSFAALKFCFPVGTPVSTPEGSKSIESVRAGDQVWAYDVVSSTWQPRRVVQTFSSQYDGMMVYVRLEGEQITSTARHPFWVVRGERLKERSSLEHLPSVPDGATQEGAWVDACDLEEGDELLLQDRRIVHVQSLATVDTRTMVYNFEVEELHTYAVGGLCVLVHNTAACNVDELLEGVTVYRVWGGDAKPFGRFWTPIDPRSVDGFRIRVGLPDENFGTYLSVGRLKNMNGTVFSDADPLRSGILGTMLPGGLPQVYIPNPAFQVQIVTIFDVVPNHWTF